MSHTTGGRSIVKHMQPVLEILPIKYDTCQEYVVSHVTCITFDLYQKYVISNVTCITCHMYQKYVTSCDLYYMGRRVV